jgi:hypothetical protein
VEGGVEDGDLRLGAEELARLGDRIQRRSVLERRHLAHSLDVGDHFGIEGDRLEEAPAAVDDAVPDRSGAAPGLAQRGENFALVVAAGKLQLEAGRAGVDDENGQHGPTFYLHSVGFALDFGAKRQYLSGWAFSPGGGSLQLAFGQRSLFPLDDEAFRLGYQGRAKGFHLLGNLAPGVAEDLDPPRSQARVKHRDLDAVEGRNLIEKDPHGLGRSTALGWRADYGEIEQAQLGGVRLADAEYLRLAGGGTNSFCQLCGVAEERIVDDESLHDISSGREAREFTTSSLDRDARDSTLLNLNLRRARAGGGPPRLE